MSLLPNRLDISAASGSAHSASTSATWRQKWKTCAGSPHYNNGRIDRTPCIGPFCARYPHVSLATFRRNGAGVETPVWFATLGGKLYVVTDGTSAKVKRIRATKRVRVAACNVSGRVSGEWFDGKGRVVSDRKLVERAHAALQRKYGWQMWLLDAGSTLFGRIGRRAYLELSLG